MGCAEGWLVGCVVGWRVGCDVGWRVGWREGCDEGCPVGLEHVMVTCPLALATPAPCAKSLP